MNFFIIVLFSLITISSAQEYIAGRYVSQNRRFGRASALNPADVCKDVVGISSYCLEPGTCAKDAKLFICNAGADAEKGTACPAQKPYCVGEPGRQGCSAKPDPSCPSENKLCKSPGYYPEPSNCYQYYYCYEDSTDPAKKVIKSYAIECPIGAPFNPAGPQDRKCQVGGKCVTANCTKDLTAEWRPMNYTDIITNRVAVKCVDAKVDYVNVCPAGLSLDLSNTDSDVCKIKCLANYQKGVYAADNAMYYLCLLGKEYVRRCEVGQKFNGEKLECV